MRKTQVTGYLDPAQTEKLEARSAKLRISRSAYVSRIIEADLAATVDDMAEQLIQLEADLNRTALMMHALVTARGPDAVREVQERVDGKFGAGTHARLIGELGEGADDAADQRRL